MILKDLKIDGGELLKYVAVLSDNEKGLLVGKSFDYGSSYFNVIVDNFGNNVISAQEIDSVVDKNYLWLQSLKLIDYVPVDYSNLPFYLG